MSATAVITVVDGEKVEHLNELHRQVEKHKGSALALALQAGYVLLEIKSELRHGEFGAWLQQHFEGSDRTARQYMQLASAPEIRHRGADLTIRQAREQIAEPRRMSAGEMGDVFRGSGVALPARAERAEVAAFSGQQERKERRARELLEAARSAAVEAHEREGLTRQAIARSYRDAARAAQRAAVMLDELAISFER